jgi:hypothetical protein
MYISVYREPWKPPYIPVPTSLYVKPRVTVFLDDISIPPPHPDEPRITSGTRRHPDTSQARKHKRQPLAMDTMSSGNNA